MTERQDAMLAGYVESLERQERQITEQTEFRRQNTELRLRQVEALETIAGVLDSILYVLVKMQRGESD